MAIHVRRYIIKRVALESEKDPEKVERWLPPVQVSTTESFGGLT